MGSGHHWDHTGPGPHGLGTEQRCSPQHTAGTPATIFIAPQTEQGQGPALQTEEAPRPSNGRVPAAASGEAGLLPLGASTRARCTLTVPVQVKQLSQFPSGRPAGWSQALKERTGSVDNPLGCFVRPFRHQTGPVGLRP